MSKLKNTFSLDTLRQVAINELALYSHHNWTDFNVSDPGIVILENLLTAMSRLDDLQQQPIRDLVSISAQEPASSRLLSRS